MSERRQSPGEGKLPLPSPRSPQELDDKILAYARDNAPERKPFLQPRWVAGLATASVVVLALFITEPQQPTPDFSAPAPALQENLPPGAARAKAVKTKPAAKMKMSRSAGQAAPLDKYEMRADEPMLEREVAADAMTAGTMSDEDMPSNVHQPLELTAPATVLKSFSSEEIQGKLQHYADLVEQGEQERARAAYQQLRQACPDCALPDTLAQAIVTTLQTE